MKEEEEEKKKGGRRRRRKRRWGVEGGGRGAVSQVRRLLNERRLIGPKPNLRPGTPHSSVCVSQGRPADRYTWAGLDGPPSLPGSTKQRSSQECAPAGG